MCLNAYMQFIDPLGKIQKELALVGDQFWGKKILKNSERVNFFLNTWTVQLSFFKMFH